VITRSDPLLADARKNRRLMRLLESMTARDKKRRISSHDVELTLENYIDRLQNHSRALVGASPAWSIIPGLLSVMALSVLIYSYIPRSPKIAVSEAPQPRTSYKNELIPTL
ncbi:MAG: hypothetical protein P1V97_17325, partial [Planctomycetota bacterium]|nr:hypothetical protein [Planctomycetota bacterium]